MMGEAMSEPNTTVTICCAWLGCAAEWEGRWDLVPNEWGWPSWSDIDFLKQRGLISREVDRPYLCETHTHELRQRRDEQGNLGGRKLRGKEKKTVESREEDDFGIDNPLCVRVTLESLEELRKISGETTPRSDYIHVKVVGNNTFVGVVTSFTCRHFYYWDEIRAFFKIGGGDNEEEFCPGCLSDAIRVGAVIRDGN